MGRIRYFTLAMSLLIPVKVFQAILLPTLFALLIISFPLKAHSINCNVSGEVPFSVIKE